MASPSHSDSEQSDEELPGPDAMPSPEQLEAQLLETYKRAEKLQSAL